MKQSEKNSNLLKLHFYLRSYLGLERAKGPCRLLLQLPPAHLSTTHGGFTLTLLMLNIMRGSCEYLFYSLGLTQLGIEPAFPFQ